MCTRVVPQPCSTCPSPTSSSPAYLQSPPSDDPLISSTPSSVHQHRSKTPSFSRRRGAAIRTTTQSAISAQRDELEKRERSSVAFDAALHSLPDKIGSSLYLNRYTGQLSLPGIGEDKSCASCAMTLPAEIATADLQTPTLRTKIVHEIATRNWGSNKSSSASSAAHSPSRSRSQHRPDSSQQKHSTRQRPSSRADATRSRIGKNRDDGVSFSTSTTDDESHTPPSHIMDSGIAMSESEDQCPLFDQQQMFQRHHSSSWRDSRSKTQDPQPESHTHTLNFLSQRYPTSESQHSILKRACIRTFSCEATYHSSPSPDTASALLFGDAQAGYTIAHIFKLQDERARGGLRTYALLCVGSKDLDKMMRVFTSVTRCFRNMIERITALSDSEAAKRASSRLGADGRPLPLVSPVSPAPPSVWHQHHRDLSGATGTRSGYASPISGFASRSRRVSASMVHLGQQQQRRTAAVPLTEMLGREKFFVQMHAEFVKSLVQLDRIADGRAPSGPAPKTAAVRSAVQSRPVSRRHEKKEAGKMRMVDENHHAIGGVKGGEGRGTPTARHSVAITS